jgi:hypothetical protein
MEEAVSSYSGEERRLEHVCLHEGDIAVLKQFMRDQKDIWSKVQNIFIQGAVQLVITVAILVVVVVKMFGGGR